ncbi:MAG: alpha/beta fold hydrolase [Halobacterium sp.]
MSAPAGTAASETAPNARTASAPGGSVAYTEYGDPAGAPVVFLHGTPGSRVLASVYDDAASERGVRVIGFDRPGYGRTPPRPDYGPEDAGALVAAVLDDAGVDDAGLVAFSGGVPHALAATASHPDRVAGVDVVAGAVPPSYRGDTPTPQRVLGALAEATPRLLGALLRGQAWVADRRPPAFVTAQYTTDDAPEVPPDVASAAKRDFLEALSETRAGAVREARQFTRDWSVPADAVDCRVRWFHGGRDANAAPDAARAYAADLPNAAFVALPDADHLGALAATRGRVLDRWARD